jgi:hypothetical protein
MKEIVEWKDARGRIKQVYEKKILSDLWLHGDYTRGAELFNGWSKRSRWAGCLGDEDVSSGVRWNPGVKPPVGVANGNAGRENVVTDAHLPEGWEAPRRRARVCGMERAGRDGRLSFKPATHYDYVQYALRMHRNYSKTCEIRTPLRPAKSVPYSEVSSFHSAICTENSVSGPDEVSLFHSCPHFTWLLFTGFTVFSVQTAP